MARHSTYLACSLLACSLWLCAASPFVNAEVIRIGKQSPEVDRSQLPQRGMSMANVIRQYGEPVKKSEPIGNPPITQWFYDQYTVYFEHQHVVQSVVNAKPSATTEIMTDTATTETIPPSNTSPTPIPVQ
jgi:hypothetical protein